MDEHRRRAWDALALGPLWRLRAPPADAPPADAQVAAAQEAGGAPAPAQATRTDLPADGEAQRDPRAAGEEPGLAVTGPTGVATPTPSDERREGRVAAGPAAAGDASAPDPSASAPGQWQRERLIAGLPWSGLVDAVSACVACELGPRRRNAVFGIGPQSATWMLVGEAPGEQEDLSGMPFVGSAGQLLDRMLASIGVDRERDVFITNVLKSRPPRNRDPLPQEVAACEPFLLRQIELVRPRIIVVLGRFAAQSLLRTDATIASLRGRVHTYRCADREIPLVVTYHPAYLLRTLPDKAKAWADLRLARRSVDAAGC
jgi:DNA polymerase